MTGPRRARHEESADLRAGSRLEQPLIVSSTWWWLTAAIAVSIVVGIGSIGLVGLIGRPLAVLFLGITLAATLDPIVHWLSRWIPRAIAVILIYLLLVALLIIVGWLIVPTLVAQVSMVIDVLPDLLDRAQPFFDRVGGLQDGGFGSTVTALIGSVGSRVTLLPGTLVGIGASLFIALFISLYWLLEEPDIEAFFMSLLPKRRAVQTRALLAEAGAAMGGYLQGVTLNALIVGTIVYVGLLVIGVDYPLVFALLAGSLELIPVIGPIIAGLIIVALTFFQSVPKALITAGFLIIMQQVENNLLVPNIMSAETHISPLTTIIAILIGGTTGGVVGVLVAIPIAAFLQVILARAVAPALRRRTGAAAVEQAELDEDPVGEIEKQA